MYRCISDRYAPTADTFASVEDFQAMCRASFGEEAELRQDGESYRDDQGIVLEHVAATGGEIAAATTTDAITAHLDSFDVAYTESGDGIRCELADGRALLLYQHPQSDGADIAGLWAYSLVGDCSGGLDSFEELTELVS